MHDHKFTFGVHAGETFRDVFEKYKSYVRWVLGLADPRRAQLTQFKDYAIARIKGYPECDVCGAHKTPIGRSEHVCLACDAIAI